MSTMMTPQPSAIPAVKDLASALPHYSHNAPIIGLTILAITAVAIAIALWRNSRHR
jgi:hypothetical protein